MDIQLISNDLIRATASKQHRERWSFITRPFTLSSLILVFYVFTIFAWSETSEQSAQYSRLVGLGLTFVFMVEFLLSKTRKISLPMEFVPLSLFLAWEIQSLFWTTDTYWAFIDIRTIFQLLVFWLVSVNVMVCYGSVMPTNVGLLLGLTWAIFLAIKSNGMSLTQTTEVRVGSSLINSNAYAIALTIGVLAGFYLYHSNSRVIRLLLIVFIVFAVQQIFFFTGSRKGMLGVIIAPIMYYTITLILNGRNNPKQIFLFLIGVVAAYFLANWILVHAPFAERLIRFRQESSFTARVDLMNLALRQWQSSPLIGHGANQFRVLYFNQFGVSTYSHNNYLELLVNTGLVGTGIYYAVYACIVGGYLQIIRRHAITTNDIAWVFTLVTILLLWDFWQVSYAGKLNWLLLAQLAALRQLLSRQVQVPNSK